MSALSAQPARAASPLRVLLVEDDAALAAEVGRALGAVGYAVEQVGDGPAALGHVAAARTDGRPFGLVVLDLGLPTLDGLDVCRRLRAEDAITPVLILSGRIETRDVVRGLELGADDYVAKPYDADVLIARVGALVRRAATAASSAARAADEPVHNGALAVYPKSRRVVLRGQAVALTPKEFDLLLLLVRHPDQTFTRDDLLDAVWGTAFAGYGHTVNTHINRLRAKIEADPGHPTCIETVWGVGYRFAAASDACP